MIDTRLIREQPDLVRAAMAKRGMDAPIDAILELEERRRQTLTSVEALKAERNQGSKLVQKASDAAERQSLIETLRTLGDDIDRYDVES
ncbi:MAG: serine--tRNA ligase, partial [Chloroflexota bacterium]|nr:serine--tRNA ligase [Chloroflexota bacterium]